MKKTKFILSSMVFPKLSEGSHSVNTYADRGSICGASQAALVVKNPLPAQETSRHGLLPGPEDGHDSPLQYSRLENRLDRGACRATVHGAIKSRTGLKRLPRQAGLFRN